MVHQNYRLSFLKIENFRQYRDTSIKFSQDPDRAFTIIRGANGAGKTNIMNAITWCLYGTEKHLGDDKEDLPIVNTRVLQNNPDKMVNMRVVLVLADSGGDKFKIERRLVLYNSGATNSTIRDKEEGITMPSGSTPTTKKSFQWYDTNGGGWKSTDYFDKSVKDLLPGDLASYFLFDGEKLEDFFDQVDNTKRGIEDVSQIKVVENAIETLNKVTKQKRRSAKNLDPQALRCEEMMDGFEEKLAETKDKISELDKMMTTKKKRIEEIEATVVMAGGDAGELQMQSSEIKNKMEQLQKQQDDSNSDLREYVLEHMPGTLMLDSIAQTLEHIGDKTKKGVLPPRIRDTFIKELLDGGRCICGNSISDGEPRANVAKMLEDAQYSKISEICIQLKFTLNPLLETGGIMQNMVDRQRHILERKKNIEKHHDQLADLEARINKVGNEFTKDYGEEKKRLREEVDESNREMGFLLANRDELDAQLEKAKRDYDRELRKDQKYAHLTRQLGVCNSALEGLTNVKEELLEDVRGRVERHTEEYFLKFLWKKDTYDHVTIKNDYRITAHHVDGYDARVNLSKGEKLVLALSFMAALRKITGFGFPLIIDTPLGRVSGEPRHNIAKFLPKFLENTQVTLLVTDSEYQAEIKDDDNRQKFPPIRDTISKHVGMDYDIHFSGSESDVVVKN